MTVCLPIWHSTLHKSQFTVMFRNTVMQSWNSFGCKCRLRIFGAIFILLLGFVVSQWHGNISLKGSLQVTVPRYSRRFAAYNCWMQTSWQVMQRDSEGATANSGKPRRFIPMAGELRLVELLNKLQYLNLTESCYLVFNYCLVYQCVYASS